MTLDRRRQRKRIKAFHRALDGILNPTGDGRMIFTHGWDNGRPLAIAPHGYVVPRSDGFKASCGGQLSCLHCQEEFRRLQDGFYPYDQKVWPIFKEIPYGNKFPEVPLLF